MIGGERWKGASRASRAALAGGALALTGLMTSWQPAAAIPDGYRQLRLEGRLAKWAQAMPEVPVRLTYAVATADFYDDEAINCRRIGPLASLLSGSGLGREAFGAALEIALRRWERAANLVFTRTDDEARADILIGAQLRPRGIAFANVTLGDEDDGAYRMIKRSRVCLNPVRRWKIGFDGNMTVYDLIHTLTHEVGHVIGLDHPRGRNHVMSFQYRETQTGLSAGDVTGVRRIYGPAQPHRAAGLRTRGARVGAVH